MPVGCHGDRPETAGAVQRVASMRATCCGIEGRRSTSNQQQPHYRTYLLPAAVTTNPVLLLPCIICQIDSRGQLSHNCCFSMQPSLPPALVRSVLARATLPFGLSIAGSSTLLRQFDNHVRSVSSFYSIKDKVSKARGRNAHLSLPPLPITPVNKHAPAPFPESELTATTTQAEAAAQMASNPFSRIPHLPPVNELLNAALSRASKLRIRQSLRSSATAPAVTQRLRGKRAEGGSSTSSAVARNTYKVHQLALQQLEALVTAITAPLTTFLAAFPPLSRLHPFDRAVMRLALEGSETEYVQRLRDGRRLVQALKHKHEQAIKQLHTAHISRRALPAADDYDLSTLLEPPTVPVQRDLESLLAYHKQLLLHTVVMSEPALALLQQLAVRVSSTPLISTQPPPPFTVLLLGLPNVGKSSLLRALSSGRAEVQDYAFTTRGLKIGHLWMEEEEGEEDEQKELQQLAKRRAEREAEDKEGRSGKSASSTRSRRHARLSSDEDNRSVRLREQRKAQSEQAQSAQQHERAHSALLHSLQLSSPLLPIQLLDTPGLLPRPDGQRKAMELLSLTALHCLDVQCVMFVMDDTGRGGWSMDDQLTVRREIRQRYHSRIAAGEVSWLDVFSKADVADKWQLPPVDPHDADEVDAVYEEEERVRRQNERTEYRRLYGSSEASELRDGDADGVVRVSVEDDGSILTLQRAMKRQVRLQWRRVREQRGEVVESIEEEFKRMYGETQPQQEHHGQSSVEDIQAAQQQQQTAVL